MPILPSTIRYKLFDVLSKKTMRYVTAVPPSRATDLARTVYQQIERDFFINGSLSSRSRVPEIFAATWCLGREAVLVEDKLDKLTKEAMLATLSDVNDCPYCGEMLVSLVHAGDESEVAEAILASDEAASGDGLLQRRLEWVRAVATPGAVAPDQVPFNAEELPEALAALLAMSDINRFSHVVMDGSPVKVPLGSRRLKSAALRLFAGELVPTQRHEVEPGLAIGLLPESELPVDMRWAAGNNRLSTALARSAGVVESQSAGVISTATREFVRNNLRDWTGERMPLSRSWVEEEVAGLAEDEKPIARLALLLAKASYQIDDQVVYGVLNDRSEENFIRILAWCSFTAARYQVAAIAARCEADFDLAA